MVQAMEHALCFLLTPHVELSVFHPRDRGGGALERDLFPIGVKRPCLFNGTLFFADLIADTISDYRISDLSELPMPRGTLKQTQGPEQPKTTAM